MVREQDGLSRLNVRGAGQDGVALSLGKIHERLLERDHAGVKPPDRPSRPEAQVGGNLIVP